TGRIGLAIYRKNPQILMAIVEAPGNQTGIYRSEDAGATWVHVNGYNNRPFYYSQIRINPGNDQIVYVLSTSFQESRDGGRTFHRMPAPFGPNYDYHAMWIDPHRPDRFYLGGDKGLWLSQDGGATMHFFDNLPIEQFYKVATDLRSPYAIYGGLQDNGAYGTMSFTRDVIGIRNDAAWKMHWDDGQYVAVDPTDWRRVYSEGTQGTFRVIDPIGRTDIPRRASPQTITNPRRPLRFNWTTPFIISPHDPERLYYGAQYLLTSTDHGRHWTVISPDLSKHDPAKNQVGTGGITPDNTGAESYATIYTISESPLVKGLIWCGTDDGNIWVTRDGGGHWAEVDRNLPGLPPDSWVSRIVASAASPNTAYATFDDHRSDNYGTYLYKTSDGGRSWTNLSAGLRQNDPLYVITEDDRNPNLLFAGSELGLQVSLDAGRTWTPMRNGLPNVAVFDAVIQPQTRDLILATHGRGIYVLDDLTALEQWRPAMASDAVHLFAQRPGTLWVDMSRSGQLGSDTWAGENPPDVAPANPQQRDRQRLRDTPVITWYLGPDASGSATLTITDPAGQTRSINVPATPGITRYVWDGRMSPPATSGRGRFAPPPPLAPGAYQLQLAAAAARAHATLTLRPDPLLHVSPTSVQ
ncbi:MAG: VPS10 domain-containing protein, partial [Terriglobales bacterium]